MQTNQAADLISILVPVYNVENYFFMLKLKQEGKTMKRIVNIVEDEKDLNENNEANIELDEEISAEEVIESDDEVEEPKKKVNLFERLKQGLTKAKQGITDRIDDVLKSYTKVDEELLEELFKMSLDIDLFKKTLNGAKEFAKTTPGKITMGLAALGLVSNIMSSGDTESPLAPELNHKDSTGPINNSSLSQKAPSSNTGRKTIYTDSSSGLQFKMSAKSKNKINQMDMARQLSAQTGGDTNINVYDDRSQVSSNWLERKFSELV